MDNEAVMQFWSSICRELTVQTHKALELLKSSLCGVQWQNGICMPSLVPDSCGIQLEVLILTFIAIQQL